MTNGRLEKELIEERKMEEKLKKLPEIFSEFYYSLRASKKSYTTISAYIRYVDNFMRFVADNGTSNDFYKTVTSSDIERYFISLETRDVNGKKMRTGSDIQATRWSALNTFFTWLVDKKEYLSKNPVDKVDRPKITAEHKVTYLTPEEIKKILDTVEQNPDRVTRERDKTIISLALTTGLRISALVNINVDDIDFDNKVIRVIEKRQKVRDIPFGGQTKKMLQSWIECRNRYYADTELEALFISKKNNRISIRMVEHLITQYAKDAGIKKHITPHKMRSSAATNLAAMGVNIQTIANMLGHENITTTQRYVAVLNEEKKNAVNALDKLI